MKKIMAIIIFLMVFQCTAQKEEHVIILANDIDWENAQGPNGLINFLKNKTFSVLRIEAAEFEEYKHSPAIVILGGPDAPDGIGDVIKKYGLLTQHEQDLSRNPCCASRKMFVKRNIFTESQWIFIFAGATREETQEAHENAENKQWLIQNIESE
jgi:hypothetical protein